MTITLSILALACCAFGFVISLGQLPSIADAYGETAARWSLAGMVAVWPVLLAVAFVKVWA